MRAIIPAISLASSLILGAACERTLDNCCQLYALATCGCVDHNQVNQAIASGDDDVCRAAIADEKRNEADSDTEDLCDDADELECYQEILEECG